MHRDDTQPRPQSVARTSCETCAHTDTQAIHWLGALDNSAAASRTDTAVTGSVRDAPASPNEREKIPSAVETAESADSHRSIHRCWRRWRDPRATLSEGWPSSDSPVGCWGLRNLGSMPAWRHKSQSKGSTHCWAFELLPWLIARKLDRTWNTICIKIFFKIVYSKILHDFMS